MIIHIIFGFEGETERPKRETILANLASGYNPFVQMIPISRLNQESHTVRLVTREKRHEWFFAGQAMVVVEIDVRITEVKAAVPIANY